MAFNLLVSKLAFILENKAFVSKIVLLEAYRIT